MPKKGKNKKGNSEEDQEEARRRALIQTVSQLKADIDKEDVAFNDYKKQIEQMKQHWESNKALLETKKKKYSDNILQIQTIKQNNSEVIHSYKQQLKSLLLHYQDDVAKNKTESEKKRKISIDNRRKEELELSNNIHKIVFMQKEKETAHATFLFQLKETHDNDVSNLLKEFTRSSRELFVHHDIKLKNTRKNLESEKLNEIQMIEMEYSEQVRQVMQFHAEELQEIKDHYKTIIEDILQQIKGQKKELMQLKKIERQTDRKYNKVITQNLETKTPQQSAEKDINKYKAELDKFYKVQRKLQELQDSEVLLWKKQKELYETTWRYEILFQKFLALQSEYNDYHNEVEKSIVKAQQQSSLNHFFLERKLSQMKLVKDIYNASLVEVLNNSDMNMYNKNNIKNKTYDYKTSTKVENNSVKENNLFVKNILQVKNAKIRELEFTLQQIQKDHRQYKLSSA